VLPVLLLVWLGTLPPLLCVLLVPVAHLEMVCGSQPWAVLPSKTIAVLSLSSTPTLGAQLWTWARAVLWRVNWATLRTSLPVLPAQMSPMRLVPGLGALRQHARPCRATAPPLTQQPSSMVHKAARQALSARPALCSVILVTSPVHPFVWWTGPPRAPGFRHPCARLKQITVLRAQWRTVISAAPAWPLP